MASKWEKPIFTKQEVNWAGRILSGRRAIKPSNEDMEKATEILNNWRAAHSYPMHIFHKRLKKYAHKLESQPITAQRLKRKPAILYKLTRPYDGRTPSMDLYQMQDIGGCRAVLSNIDSARSLVEKYYLKGDLKHIRREKSGYKNYVIEPKPDGYRGFHLVYDYVSDKKKKREYNGLKIEVQVRSKLQHLWATAVETIDFLTSQGMKFGKGKPEWAEFFRLVSSAFAGMEGCAYLDDTPQSEKELFLEIKKREEELSAAQKMIAFSAALKKLGDESDKIKKNAKFFLLELDLKESRLLIEAYLEKEKDKAIANYSEREKSHAGNKEYDIVLVSVDDAKDLQRAYPNYFAHTTEFVTHLLKIVKKY